MYPKKIFLDAIGQFSQLFDDIDQTITSIFYERHNPNIIVINYDSNEDIFIIGCENKKISIPLQQFSDFFQKNNLQLQSKKESENDVFFCSKESYETFRQILSKKFEKYIQKYEDEISNFEEEIKNFKSFIKKSKCDRNLLTDDAAIGYIIKKAYFNTADRRDKRNNTIKISKEKPQVFDVNDFIEIRSVKCNKLLYSIQHSQLLFMKTFDIAKNKYFEREKDCYEKIQIDHPYQLKYFGSIENDSKKSLILDFINGSTLKRSKNLSFMEKISIILEIMISIEVLHLEGCIYRDLKPDNIIIDKNKNAILIDFDMAKLLENNQEFTGDIGSNLYSSPEQYNENYYSFPTDIYSIGKVMYFILTSANPPNVNNEHPLPKEYRFFELIYKQCTEYNPLKRPSISKLINMFYKQIFQIFKSTLFYEKEEIEHMEKTLKTEYEIRQKEIEVYLTNESQGYKLKHINEIFEIFEYLTYSNYKTQKETMKETLSKLLEIIKEGECSLSAETLNFLGKLYNEGKYLQKDRDVSIKYLEQSSNNGCSEAQYNLGKIYFLKRDIKKAIEYYAKSAKNNNAKAQYHLGIIYKERIEVNKDEEESIEYFTQSAKQNHSKSRIELVKYFISKQEIIDKLQKKYDDEYLINIYKQFKFEYFTDMKKIESKNNEMKPFSMIDIVYYAKHKMMMIICSYKHCYLIETNKTPDEIIKFIEYLEVLYDIKFYTTNDKYSKSFDDENKFEEINTETTQLFKYFQDKHSIIYDFYFDNIDFRIYFKYYVNTTNETNYQHINRNQISSFDQLLSS